MAGEKTTMHPDRYTLAAYLDGALDEAARASVRSHLLTCPVCTACLERLRADARRITAFARATPAPDVRAAVRAKLRRDRSSAWLLRGGALAGALAALLLFALLIGISAGGTTVGRAPDRLFVTDRQNGRLLALDAGSGALQSTTALGPLPREIRYDRRLDRLYVMLEREIVAVDVRTLAITHRWAAAQPFDTYASIALDEQRGRLYVAEPAGSIALLDTATLTPTGSFHLGPAPSDLALAPGGDTLYALDEDGTLWTIDTSSGAKSAQSLNTGGTWLRGWLALSSDGRALYVLRSGAPALLRRVDTRSGEVGEAVALAAGPAPQDILPLDGGRLAIARGDNRRGGVDILGDNLGAIAQIDPDNDEHHLVAGLGGRLFGLNFTHGRISRYNLDARAVAWRTVDPSWQPWDGVFVPGGWRWPW
jgi:DNA-binding beta-propeller fold protein YncE